MNIQLPPLSLYVHIPWCVRKCPYCDFNSYPLRGELPERNFIAALLRDLEQDLEKVGERPLTSIFIGGGTPSLLSGEALMQLLVGISQRIAWAPGIEITLEANPGTADAERFAAFRAAGINRLSIGVQSFDSAHLCALGRIHGPDEALSAVAMARTAGFTNLNLDLMFGLPGQTPTQASRDVATAVLLLPQHISYYQLTLEPNTLFHQQPPPLPDEDSLWEIQTLGKRLLAETGYSQYEVSAYARHDCRCRHNLNYWSFGDYLGIGPGAHGKLSLRNGTVERSWKQRQPGDYLAGLGSGHFVSGKNRLSDDDLVIEFMLNALRLAHGFTPALFEARTGLPFRRVAPVLQRAQAAALIETSNDRIRPTTKGYAFLDDIIAWFVDSRTAHCSSHNEAV